ncbi:MAG: hypothetical protein WCV79_03320 [Candidatus Paceibacterota bacterium]|jgi:hypothetical protein
MEAQRIASLEHVTGNTTVMVAQKQVTRGLEQIKVHYAASIEEREHDKCLPFDSEEVMRQATMIFREGRVDEIVPIANPFLHLSKCKRLVRESGFPLRAHRIGHIGFDPESELWWTRSASALIIYAIRQKFLGYRGNYVG